MKDDLNRKINLVLRKIPQRRCLYLWLQFLSVSLSTPPQSGFPLHYSTATALIKVTSDLHIAELQCQFSVLSQLDPLAPFEEVDPFCLTLLGFQEKTLFLSLPPLPHPHPTSSFSSHLSSHSFPNLFFAPSHVPTNIR